MASKNLLPYSEDAEQSLLGVMLNDEGLVSSLEHLPAPSDFYLERHQIIFSAILDISETGTPLDLISLVEFLIASNKLEKTGGKSYLSMLLEKGLVGASAAQYYVNLIVDKSQRRLLTKYAYEMQEQAMNESSDISKVVEESEKNIFNITNKSQSAMYHRASEFSDEFFTFVSDNMDKKQGEFSGIPTGYDELDKYLTGFQKGELIILGARPSVGKTAFALNLLKNISIDQDIPAAFFSLEMSGRDIISRMVCAMTGIESNRIRQNMLDTQHLQDISGCISTFNKANLFISDVPSLSLFDLKIQSRRLVVKEKVEIIFVDYLGLINYFHRYDDEKNDGKKTIPFFQQVSEISRALKALARELKIPFVVLVQLNRDSEGREPTLANIRDSGAIEQDADVVMFLHRASRQDPRTILNISKQRNGPVGTLNYEFKDMVFSEIGSAGEFTGNA